jgi:hypothetical protein
MGRITRASGHLSEEQIEGLLRMPEYKPIWYKLLVVLNALVDPRPAQAIAIHTMCRFIPYMFGFPSIIDLDLPGLLDLFLEGDAMSI